MTSSSFAVAAVQLCYEHLNGSCVKTPYSPAPRLILYTVFSFGAVLAVFGNLLVMISILHFKQLHSPTNFLIASLACADFLVGVTVMPFSTVRSVESCWYFGESYCKFHTCFDGSFCYASIYHLCFISLDRYIAITDPLVYPTRFTVSVSGMCIAFSWLFAIIYSFSLLGTGANAAGLEDLVSALTCVGGCQFAVNQSWVLVNFILFFIPTLVMIVLYSNVFLIAKQQAGKIESLSIKTGRCSESYQDRVAKRERKAARTLGVTVLAFLISWLPYFLDSIIDAFLGFITPTYVYEILVWIAYYNSAMNPLIYAFFYPWFRKAIKLIVTGKVLRENSSTVNLFAGWGILRDILAQGGQSSDSTLSGVQICGPEILSQSQRYTLGHLTGISEVNYQFIYLDRANLQMISFATLSLLRITLDPLGLDHGTDLLCDAKKGQTSTDHKDEGPGAGMPPAGVKTLQLEEVMEVVQGHKARICPQHFLIHTPVQ
ncbi:trace amine-associated receptor 7a-like [Oryx dammah]|uniref:trace amine-associated receptor 7a-like n=1 Tax=Oryx dammah TaxID=59534 RepID=UPI001A9B3220|nr:trace amine-associated receptor 7a-like [Oryx dammah]